MQQIIHEKFHEFHTAVVIEMNTAIGFPEFIRLDYWNGIKNSNQSFF